MSPELSMMSTDTRKRQRQRVVQRGLFPLPVLPFLLLQGMRLIFLWQQSSLVLMQLGVQASPRSTRRLAFLSTRGKPNHRLPFTTRHIPDYRYSKLPVTGTLTRTWQPLLSTTARRRARRFRSTGPTGSCSGSSSSTEESQGLSSHSTVSKFSIESEFFNVKRDFLLACTLYAKNIQSAGVSISLLRQRVADYEREEAQADFWNDANVARAQQVTQQLSQASRLLARLLDWERWHGDAQAALEMLQPQVTRSANGASTSATTVTLTLSEQQMLLEEFTTTVTALWTDCLTAELEWLLSGPYDTCPARLLLTAGAGGTEANDWVADLVRMYTRYFEQKPGDWTCRILDSTTGDVVGYKSVELLVEGPFAYGWCRSEKGAHRLVRLSPFNAKDKRQTTFAGVEVVPELQGSSQQLKLADIELAEGDLEITTMRSGGKGGQNVNKVSSAVRIKHIPSGLQVRCTEERSQAQNKDIALNRLKSQLLMIAQELRVQEIRDIRGDVVEASWGAQIRNYVLHPYKQVKDQRSGWETTNAQAFLDGNVAVMDDCIGAYLRYKAGQERLVTETDGTGSGHN